MSSYKSISVADAAQLINTSKPMILDCRDIKDYRMSHIDAAMHVHEQLRDSLIQKGDKQRPMLIYCYYGHASEHLAQIFNDFGFEYIYSLAGGYAAWKEQNHSNR